MKAEDFWQDLLPSGSVTMQLPLQDAYPASLPDGRQLLLPVRPLPDGTGALCSLIITQASFEVVDALADNLAERLAPSRPDVIVGLPTLGLTLASAVARKLGHSRYVALGTSRKFWYDEALSVPLSSITTPEAKRLYLDPRMLQLLAGKRVALVDDVISSGRSIVSGLELLARAGITPAAIGCAMLQGQRWQESGALFPNWRSVVVGVVESPRLVAVGGGWLPE